MSTKYSKKIINHVILDGDEARKYKANKLSAYEVSIEGFKLLKAMTPSFGVAIDAFQKGEDDIFNDRTQTFTEMLHFLSENLTIEVYTTLVDKLMGSLYINDKPVEDWSDHFDEYPQDFLEVLAWTGEENFKSFFMQSTIIAPLVKKISPTLNQMKGQLGYVLSNNETDSNEES